MQRHVLLAAGVAMFGTALALLAVVPDAAAEDLRPPAQLYGELFEQVQLQRLFADSKTFADAVADGPAGVIVAEYRRQRRSPGFDLRAFVARHFRMPADGIGAGPVSAAGDVRDHIDALWPQLTRQPDAAQRYSSLLPLPYPYVVPGGRFREIYYWDSYFTMLGLEESGRHDLTQSMLGNFAYLIDHYGHIPNGNRTYYLSRSQPPFFAAMVELVAAHDGEAVYRRYLPQLEREHAFWMAGAERVAPGTASRRVVRLADGSLLNRYWDDRDTPRDESYAEDVATAAASGRPAAEVYRNLRAAAESGWDFSSRWFADGQRLTTLRTVDIVPVDLNSLLYRLEQTLATAYRVVGHAVQAQGMGARAWARRAAMHRHLWNEPAGAFGDYAWREQRLTAHLTAAALYPLYFGVATQAQARRTASFVRARLLQPDGIATTMRRTGQQWDAPNGWAPLQGIAIAGLRNQGEPALAQEIACRWIRENRAAFRSTGQLVEKYDVSGDGLAGGGEYPLQDGFGWTNGVLRKLLALYPEADRQRCPARPDGTAPEAPPAAGAQRVAGAG
ncbi:MAG: alpha,alpha-trehalase TreA [Gammaproteobacteria bacterium]|nr:alpha,alpha-trehalase TreA [Gammaproteobacteria bacterium]